MGTAEGTILHCQHLIVQLEDFVVGLIHRTARRLCGGTDHAGAECSHWELGGTWRGAGQFAPHSVVTGRIPNGFGDSAGIVGISFGTRVQLVLTIRKILEIFCLVLRARSTPQDSSCGRGGRLSRSY